MRRAQFCTGTWCVRCRAYVINGATDDEGRAYCLECAEADVMDDEDTDLTAEDFL